MDIWNDFILPELLTAAKDDRDYQKMLAENRVWKMITAK